VLPVAGRSGGVLGRSRNCHRGTCEWAAVCQLFAGLLIFPAAVVVWRLQMTVDTYVLGTPLDAGQAAPKPGRCDDPQGPTTVSVSAAVRFRPRCTAPIR
jgi:hypothetical protein